MVFPAPAGHLISMRILLEKTHLDLIHLEKKYRICVCLTSHLIGKDIGLLHLTNLFTNMNVVKT